MTKKTLTAASGALSRSMIKNAAIIVFFGFIPIYSLDDIEIPLPSQSPSSFTSSVSTGSYELTSSTKETSLSTSTIDNSINENSYYIGGGDRLRIYLVDMPSMNFGGVITQDYFFIEPTLGLIPIGGKVSLVHAKKIIADFMRHKLKGKGHNRVRVLFEGVKTAHITAFGSVNNPGTYSFPGHMRLWDVLKAVSKVNVSELNIREVRIKNGDSVSYFDLLSFLYKGDFSQNPYIYPQDEMFIAPATRKVYIGGAGLRAWISGQVPILKGETAKNFLSFFFFNETADSEHIIIQRTDGNREYQQITYNLKYEQPFPLKNNDMIIVPVKSDSTEQYIVIASGELARPGTYPIPKGGTAVQTVVALAGGYTSFADTNRMVILRIGKEPPPIAITDGITRPEINGALKVAAAIKDYLIIRIKEHPETILKPGDKIFVPSLDNTVYLSGCVKFPGCYPFKPHRKKEYYLHLAGGLAERADKANIAIVSPFLDAYVTKSSKDEIEAGDFITVPVKREFKVYERIILPTLSMLLASSGFLIGIVSILR